MITVHSREIILAIAEHAMHRLVIETSEPAPSDPVAGIHCKDCTKVVVKFAMPRENA